MQHWSLALRGSLRVTALVAAGTSLIAATYGLVRLAFGLHLPEIGEALGLDLATLGLISAAASVVYGFAACIGFLFGDRFPRSLVLIAGVSAGGGSVGIALAHDSAVFSTCAIVSSAGAGLASPALVRIIHRAAASRERAAKQAIVNAGTGPGLVAAGILAWALAPDWRLAWMIAGAATVIAAVAVLVLDHPDGSAAAAARSLPSRGWWVSHRLPLLAAVTFGFGAAAVWNYARTALVDAGAPDTLSLWAWVLLGAGGAAVIATAPLARRCRPRTLWMLSTIFASIGTVLLGVLPGEPALAGLMCTIFGWGYVTATGALIEWTTQIDGSRAATGTAVLFVVFMLGQAVGAAATGALLVAIGYAGAFAVAGAVGCAAGLLGSEQVTRAARRACSRSADAPCARRAPRP